MIVGVGRTPPDLFFSELEQRDIVFDYNVTAICSELTNLQRFCNTHHHIIFFNIPQTLVRVHPLYAFDFRAEELNNKVEFVEREPIWSILNFLKFRVNPPPTKASIENHPNVVAAMIEAERKNDVLDKINLLTSIMPKASRRKAIEKTLFESLLSDDSSDSLEAKLLKIIGNHRSPEKSEILAVSEIVKWYRLPIRQQLIKGLEKLLREPNAWKQNVSFVAAQFGVRPFELGYIMSFLERNQK